MKPGRTLPRQRAGRHEQTIGERLVADQTVLRPLPFPYFALSNANCARYKLQWDFKIHHAIGRQPWLVGLPEVY
jgi:hypothetical protein